MKVGICSDLHLEFYGLQDAFFENKEKVDLLLICGDIAEIRNYPEYEHSFFDRLEKSYEKVMIIPGNHEGYHASLEMVDDTFSDMSALYPNFLFDAGRNTIEGIDFIGTTLWTNFHNCDAEAMLAASMSMNDYRLIEYKNGRLTPKDIFEIHHMEFKWLQELVATSKSDRIFIYTHHAPTYKSISENYVDWEELNHSYASDLSEFILDNPKIEYWVHGHVHDNFDYMVGDHTRVIAHPRGYPPKRYTDVYVDYLSYKPLVLEI